LVRLLNVRAWQKKFAHSCGVWILLPKPTAGMFEANRDWWVHQRKRRSLKKVPPLAGEAARFTHMGFTQNNQASSQQLCKIRLLFKTARTSYLGRVDCSANAVHHFTPHRWPPQGVPCPGSERFGAQSGPPPWPSHQLRRGQP